MRLSEITPTSPLDDGDEPIGLSRRDGTTLATHAGYEIKKVPTPTATAYAAFEGETPVGILLVHSSDEVINLRVNRAHQRKGLGMALYDAAIADRGRIVSDDRQTQAAQGLWRRLAQRYHISALTWSDKEVPVDTSSGEFVANGEPVYGSGKYRMVARPSR